MRGVNLSVDKERDMGVSSVADQDQFGRSGLALLLKCMGALAVGLMLSGCDQLGIDTPAKIEERVVAESKAVGGACRHAMRVLEACYTMNPKSQKAAIADGWREMYEYMRENKLEGVTPTIAKAMPGRKSSQDEEEDPDAEDVTAEETAASKPKAHASKDTEADKATKAGSEAEPTKAEKTGKAERGAENKSKRDKRDTLHAEAESSKPH